LRESIADSLDLPLEEVVLIRTPGAGCYGHNGADDAAFEATLVAMSMPGSPVLLKWTREEERAWEPYCTAVAAELRATPDAEGGRFRLFRRSHQRNASRRP
jgi:CO/xanthine dehydrogenase Mo-binding subunit